MKPLGEDARAFIEAARLAERPPGLARARVKASLDQAIAAGVPGPAIDAPMAGGVAKAAWLKGLLMGAVIVASAGGAVSFVARATPVPVQVQVPTLEAVVPSVGEGQVALVEAPVDVGEPEGPVEAPTVAEASGPPVRSPHAKSRAIPTSGASAPTPAPVSAQSPPAPPPSVPLPTEDVLEAEARALREVHIALRAGDSARALRMLEVQRVQFAKGQLAPERAAAGVLALCASSPSIGVEAFEQFAHDHPGSPLLSRLKKACHP